MSETAFLLEKRPDGGMNRWPLDADEIIIGRKPPAEILLPAARVSRQHAQITRNPKGYFIRDLGSRNGTFVNGEVVGSELRRLVAGDEIVFGGVIALRFDDPEETVGGAMVGRVEGVWINAQTLEVWVDMQPVEPPLSPQQLALLQLLYEDPGQVIPRQRIIAEIWPDVDPAGVSGEAINGLIKRLRARLREVQPEREYIEVLRGHGVRLIDSLSRKL